MLDALKRMHTYHYMHLPVVDSENITIGLVDVQQLTMSMIDYLVPLPFIVSDEESDE